MLLLPWPKHGRVYFGFQTRCLSHPHHDFIDRYFGTTYYFDADAGVYAVGGENTFYGNPQAGYNLINDNFKVWTQMLMSADSVPGDIGAAGRSGGGGDDSTASSHASAALVLATISFLLSLASLGIIVAKLGFPGQRGGSRGGGGSKKQPTFSNPNFPNGKSEDPEGESKI